ncbi:MAG: DUF2341 domain-containing protein, partial [Thermoplasmata archaeon]
TGYRIENLGADAKIEVAGYSGEIRSAVASRFIEQSASSKPELNYSAWENAGEVRVEKSTNIVEGYAKIAGLKNPVSLVLMRHYESSAYAEKRGMALVSKTEGSLVVYQNFIGNDVVNADEDVLELRLIAKGKDVHVESISVANANVSLPKKDIAVNEELTVRCKAKSLSDGNAYAFAVSSVDTNVPYRIVGNGGKAYFGSLPSGIVIDGAFGDWQGVQKGVDVPGDVTRNIDLREYASAIASNAYFYMAVDGTMLAGCEIPVLGARPPVQPGPPTPVVIKENLGMDVARVYIDLMNSTINTFNPAMISHGYLIELQGRNGQVISARAWKWENGVKAEEIQNPNIAHGLSDGKIEFSVSGTALQGLTNDTKFYFEMTNWLGEKDACELSYLVGMVQTRVGGDGSYGSSLLNEFTGSYNKVVLVNDRYTSTTKGALRLDNNTIGYGGLNATDVDANGNLTVSNTRYWNGTYYFRYLKITSTGNITASGYMTVIRIYAEVIEIDAGGIIYLAGKGGQGGAGGIGSGGDGYTGQDGNDWSGPSPSTNGQADGGGGGGGVVSSDMYGGWGGGGGGFAGNGGDGGRGGLNGVLGSDGNNGSYGRAGISYSAAGTIGIGSGGGGGSAGQHNTTTYVADGGAGGSGGGALLLSAWNVYINGIVNVSGLPGNDGGTNHVPGGGGGGGSGGCILIRGANVTIGMNAELNASGGKGGNGGDDISATYADDEAGGGGGGGGGAIWIYADNAYNESINAKFNVSGGAGGLGSVGSLTWLNNNGTNGNAGSLIKPSPGTPPNPRTEFTSMFLYSPSGSYISPVYDAGRISFWRALNITYDTHWVGTSVEVSYKVWNFTEPETWTYLTTISGGTGVLSAQLSFPDSAFGRFLRYNLTLKTTVSMYTGWEYYVPIRIDNRNNPETLWNYTLNFTLDTASLIAQGKMRADCGDLRFANATGVEIPHWIESGINTATTLIWLKVPQIAGSSITTIYMFYGNPNAQNIANASQTFLFYDDFESGNLNKWSNVADGIWNISATSHQGNYSMVANGYSGSITKYIVAKNLNIQNVVFESWWRLSNISGTDVSQCVRASNGMPIYDYEVNWELSDWALAKTINGTWTRLNSTTSSSPNANTWFKVTAIINASGMKFLINDTQLLPSSGWQDMGNEILNGSIAFKTFRVPSGHYWWIDDVRVRNYTEPVPNVYLRPERTSSNSPTVYSINLSYHKPKLLIKKVEFPPSGKHQVVLYNNDTISLVYKNLYLNASKSTFLMSDLSLAPHTEAIVFLGDYFNNPAIEGDFLFLNDSTSSINGKSPNGIIDFVNWTDANGNPPPSEGGIAATNLEWKDEPVDLSVAHNLPEAINRTEVSSVPKDNDIKEDWYVSEVSYLAPLSTSIFLYLLCSRKTRKLKRL